MTYLQLASVVAAFGGWIGVPYWGHGYCTEATAALIGFGSLGLHKQFALHLPENLASARVITKNGLRYIGDVTGSLRGHNSVLKHSEISAQEYFAKRP